MSSSESTTKICYVNALLANGPSEKLVRGIVLWFKLLAKSLDIYSNLIFNNVSIKTFDFRQGLCINAKPTRIVVLGQNVMKDNAFVKEKPSEMENTVEVRNYTSLLSSSGNAVIASHTVFH